MHEQSSPPNDERTVRVNIGRVESIDLHELTENELETLEKGPPNQDFNYAISLISTVFAFLVAWATSDFKSDKIEIIVILYSIGAVITSSYLMFRWRDAKRSFNKVVAAIRDRKRPE